MAMLVSGLLSVAALLQPHSTITPAQSQMPPYLTGWGGVRLDEAGTNVTSQKIDYVLVIVMENKDYTQVIGNSCCPYINSLANQYGLATNYHNSDNRGSLPNYLALTTGNGQSWGACNAAPAVCTGFTPVSTSLVDLLNMQHVSWKAYIEAMPTPCYSTNNEYYVGPDGVYYPRHNPFIYFSTIIANQSECNKVVPAGTNDAVLLKDLSSTTTASSFMWLTPNGCNQTHDCAVGAGETYLAGVVPKILSSNIFTTQNAALFIVWDEGGTSNHTPMIIAGPAVKTAYQSNTYYDHYSMLNTIETNWNLASITKNDTNAKSMTEFFKTTKSISDMELHMQRFQSLGYNIVRVSFQSPCSAPYEMGAYSTTNLARTISLAQKYNMWLVIDMHGYHDIEPANQSCWLNNWQSIIQQSTATNYSQLIWEPENEQSGFYVTLAQLSSAYQAWINQARAMGDNHWIIVSNQCVNSCAVWPLVATTFPTVTDPLHMIMINWHSYMYYPYWKDPKTLSLLGYAVNTNGWTNATAETVANLWLNATKNGIALTGYRAINTEIGADPIGGIPPDSMIASQTTGCDSYTLTTLHYIQTLVKLYAANGISWTGWAAGSWSTSGATGCGSVSGVSYGVLQPGQGWGLQLFTQGKVALPQVLSSAFNMPNTAATGQTLSFTPITNGGIPPYSHNWNFGDGTNITASISNHYYANSGTYKVTLTTTDSSGRASTYNRIITVNGAPLHPPPGSGPPNGGNGSCLLCALIPSTNLLTSTLMMLGIGIFSGLGLYYARFLAKGRAENKQRFLLNESKVISVQKRVPRGNNRALRATKHTTRL
jgi:acid phosphatase